MPRRKVLKVSLKELARGSEVFLSLKDDPIFEGYDLSTLSISIQAQIKPAIKDAARAALFLESYLAANPKCCQQFGGFPYTSKINLAKMMRVSRSTLDKWFDDGLICASAPPNTQNLELLNPHHILLQLRAQKKE